MGFIDRLLHRVPDPDDWHVEDKEIEDMGMRQVDGQYVDYGERMRDYEERTIQVAIREPDPSLMPGQDYGWDVSFEKESYVEVYNDGRREPVVDYTATHSVIGMNGMVIYKGIGDSMLSAAADLVEQLLADCIS